MRLLFFCGRVHLQGLYAQDNEKDTLLFTESLKVNVSLLKMLNRTIQIDNVELLMQECEL